MMVDLIGMAIVEVIVRARYREVSRKDVEKCAVVLEMALPLRSKGEIKYRKRRSLLPANGSDLLGGGQHAPRDAASGSG